MKKKNNAVATLAIILLVLSAIGVSWGVTCGLVKLITMCFGWEFSWGASTGVWLLFVLFNWMRKSNKEQDMHAFKIVTTTLNIIMMGIIFFFMRGTSWEEDKASVAGFSFMQILYLMNMFCMWR